MKKEEIIKFLDDIEDRVSNIEWDIYQFRLKLEKKMPKCKSKTFNIVGDEVECWTVPDMWKCQECLE